MGPQSPRAVPASPVTMVLSVCPRAQIPTASAATACLGSRAHSASWTLTSVRPGRATMGPPAATLPIAMSVNAPWAMQVMAQAVPLLGWGRGGEPWNVNAICRAGGKPEFSFAFCRAALGYPCGSGLFPRLVN